MEKSDINNSVAEQTRRFLRLYDVHKSYQINHRKIEVLRGVNLEVDKGEFLAILGASGAGKSTLLHIVGGLDTPDSGTIEFNGISISTLSKKKLASFRNKKIGFIFQSYHLFPELDAVENVSLPAIIAGSNPTKTNQYAKALLERVGLGSRLEHKPSELSGGEQQRVAIARALINNPELVLADEPTGNLDSHSGQEILNLLKSIQTEFNTTLIIATHDSTVANYSSRIVHLCDGIIESK